MIAASLMRYARIDRRVAWHVVGVSAGTIARLFPEAPGGGDPWLTLLWATGRAELPGHPRLTTWRSDSTPRS